MVETTAFILCFDTRKSDACLFAGQIVFLRPTIDILYTEKFFRLSSFVFNACSALLFPDTFSKEAIILVHSTCYEFAVTLIAFCPGDTFISLTVNSFLVIILQTIAVKIEFLILSATVSTNLPISQSRLTLKHRSNDCRFIEISLVDKLLPAILTVSSWLPVLSFTTTFCFLLLAPLPAILSWPNSSNWLESLLLDSILLSVETKFALMDEIHLKH